MLFSSFRPFQASIQRSSASIGLGAIGSRAIASLHLLPWLFLLAGSSTLAQAQPRGVQESSGLDNPPSPEVAATLCDETAQSFSDQVIITSQTVCQSGLTPPSLWWTREQVAKELRTSGKLVSDWSAQLKTLDTPGQVRLIVNPQMWSLMDYFERYDFISNFGLAAQSFGYQTEIYNTKGIQLASYICAISDSSGNLSSTCEMDLGSSVNFGRRSSRTL